MRVYVITWYPHVSCVWEYINVSEPERSFDAIFNHPSLAKRLERLGGSFRCPCESYVLNNVTSPRAQADPTY